MQVALISLLIFCSAVLYGGGDAALTAALKRVGDCRAVAADFTQTRWLKDLDMQVVIRGGMVSEKRGRLLWRVDDPVPSVTLISDRKLLHWDKTTGKVAELAADLPWLKLLRDSFVDCLSGDLENLARNFAITTVPPATLRLKPLTPELGKLYAWIELTIDLERDAVSRIVLEEPSGDRMTIEFSGVRRDPETPESLWRIPPK